MKNKLFLLVISISLFLCSCQEQLTSRKKSSQKGTDPGQNYMAVMDQKTKIITVTSGDRKFGLKMKSARNVEGCVTLSGNDDLKGMKTPACGSYCITWGKAAIELSFADQKNKNALSADAKAVLKKYGCPANYLNQHSCSISPIPATPALFQKLGDLKVKDQVKLKGYDTSLETMNIDGKNVGVASGPIFFYVTEAVVNNKKI